VTTLPWSTLSQGVLPTDLGKPKSPSWALAPTVGPRVKDGAVHWLKLSDYDPIYFDNGVLDVEPSEQ